MHEQSPDQKLASNLEWNIWKDENICSTSLDERNSAIYRWIRRKLDWKVFLEIINEIKLVVYIYFMVEKTWRNSSPDGSCNGGTSFPHAYRNLLAPLQAARAGWSFRHFQASVAVPPVGLLTVPVQLCMMTWWMLFCESRGTKPAGRRNMGHVKIYTFVVIWLQSKLSNNFHGQHSN